MQVGDVASTNGAPALTVVAIYRTGNTATPPMSVWAATTAATTTLRAALYHETNTNTYRVAGRRLDAHAVRSATGFANGLLTNHPHVHIGSFDTTNDALALFVDSATSVATNSFVSAGAFEATDSNSIWLGTRHASTTQVFVGTIHELLVWRRALTPTEIQAIMDHARAYWSAET
jgi:hypothetical protein